MNGATEEVPAKPERQIRGKKYWMITGIIVGMVIIVAVLGFLNFQTPGNNENTATPSLSPHTVSGTSPPVVASTILQTDTYPRGTSIIPVDFVLHSGETTSCGLTCRQMDATITNIGSETAHNVCITVNLHNSRNEVINLNGEPFLRQCKGDLAGGESKTEPISVTADCGAFATRCIGETLTLQTQVSSDEKTAQFPDQVIKV